MLTFVRLRCTAVLPGATQARPLTAQHAECSAIPRTSQQKAASHSPHRKNAMSPASLDCKAWGLLGGFGRLWRFLPSCCGFRPGKHIAGVCSSRPDSHLCFVQRRIRSWPGGSQTSILHCHHHHDDHDDDDNDCCQCRHHRHQQSSQPLSWTLSWHGHHQHYHHDHHNRHR